MLLLVILIFRTGGRDCSDLVYYMIPKIVHKEIYSIRLANSHFWLIMIGQLLYTVTLWIAGIQQGAMWKATNADGSLTYSFLQTVTAMYPYWMIRFIGGAIYFAGIIVFAYNLIMTVKNSKQAEQQAQPQTV